MSIESKADLDGLREAGRIVRAILTAMAAQVRPGITTGELNQVGAAVMRRQGARSAPMLVYDFPAETCISVNEEVVHGIPGDRVLEAGDLVKLDATMEKDGYMADAARTLAVPPHSEVHQALLVCARRAFERAMSVTRAGNRVFQIGRTIEREVKGQGFAVVRDLHGHGIGHAIHEPPTVPNTYDLRARTRLTDGLVMAVEPMVTSGTGAIEVAEDGWTVRTRDGAPAAHYEHTVVVTRGYPLLLTAA